MNKVEKISDFDLNPPEQIVSDQGLKKKEKYFRLELLRIAKSIEDFLYVCFQRKTRIEINKFGGKSN